MGGQFYIVAVLGILAHNTLAHRIPTPAESQTQILSVIEDSHERANAGVQIALTIMFDRLIDEYFEVTDGIQDDALDNPSQAIMFKEKLYLAFESTVNAVHYAIVLVQPKAVSEVSRNQAAARASVIELIRVIQKAINLLKTKQCREIPTKIGAIEEAVISAALNVTDYLYIPMKYGYRSNGKIRLLIQRSEEKAFSMVTELYEALLEALKILLAQVCPGYYNQVEDYLSSVEALERKGSDLTASAIGVAFSVIRTLLKFSSDDSCED